MQRCRVDACTRVACVLQIETPVVTASEIVVEGKLTRTVAQWSSGNHAGYGISMHRRTQTSVAGSGHGKAALQVPCEGSVRAGRRRAIIGLLSLGTAVWLAVQLAAGLAISTKAWPITGWGMFRYAQASVVPRLEVRTKNEQTVQVRSSDFGLTVNQLNRHLKRLVGSWEKPRPDARRRLAHLVHVWNRAHPADPATSAALNLYSHSRAGTVTGVRSVVTWSEK